MTFFSGKQIKLGIFIILCTLTSLLNGCGFHLRGNVNLPTALAKLAIVSTNPYGPLTLQLTQILKSMGAQIVNEQANPPVVLFIESESFTQTSVIQSASSSTEQYMMNYAVSYHVLDKDKRIIWGPKTITSKKLYSINQNQVLSADTQQQSLQQELQQNVVYQIFAQLNSTEARATFLNIPAS